MEEGEQQQQHQQQQQVRLCDMFAPPTHILHRGGGFQGARNVAKDARRWLLVNLQRDSDYACHALNRDVWRDEFRNIVQCTPHHTLVYCVSVGITFFEIFEKRIATLIPSTSSVCMYVFIAICDCYGCHCVVGYESGWTELCGEIQCESVSSHWDFGSTHWTVGTSKRRMESGQSVDL